MSAPTHAAHTPTPAESALALDLAAIPLPHAALTLLLADSAHALTNGAAHPPLPPTTLSTVHTDTPAERAFAHPDGAVTPFTDALFFPHPCHALLDTALDATLVRMTSAPTTLSPHSP